MGNERTFNRLNTLFKFLYNFKFYLKIKNPAQKQDSYFISVFYEAVHKQV